MRRLVAETRLHPADLVLPLFVKEGLTEPAPLTSMPGQVQHTEESLVDAVRAARDAGLGGVMLFGIPTVKDATGSQADAEDGILQRALRASRKVLDEVPAGTATPVLMADTCLDEFTDHGHCGVLTSTGAVDNDTTLARYASMAVAQARAGADVISPSGMMDGQVAMIRDALDDADFLDTSILAYSAKYASAYYGPFREAAESTPAFGDRRSYQMDPPNRREALREMRLDLEEGADVLMVKPALPYLDVLVEARRAFDVPLAAYHVSGEYAMIRAAAERGWLDGERAMEEALLAIKRAGADWILTYAAKQIAERLA
jgi:porphobilinogen synthase